MKLWRGTQRSRHHGVVHDLHELPWLAPPSQEDRETLAGLDGANALPDLVRLASIADRRWTASEMASIGRKLRKFVKALPSVGRPM